MPFKYPNRAHVRKHGPAGYADYTNYKHWLRDEFHFRCVYCLERERWYPSGHAAFGVEHALPRSIPDNAARICDCEILLYACSIRNSAKQDRLVLNPCQVSFIKHLGIGDDGLIVGHTTEGWQLVDLLGLNKPKRQAIRRRVLTILRLYRDHPDKPDVQELYHYYFGHPDDLPNLDALRPKSNSRPNGLIDSFFRQRAEGRLPKDYF